MRLSSCWAKPADDEEERTTNVTSGPHPGAASTVYPFAAALALSPHPDPPIDDPSCTASRSPSAERWVSVQCARSRAPRVDPWGALSGSHGLSAGDFYFRTDRPGLRAQLSAIPGTRCPESSSACQWKVGDRGMRGPDKAVLTASMSQFVVFFERLSRHQ